LHDDRFGPLTAVGMMSADQNDCGGAEDDVTNSGVGRFKPAALRRARARRRLTLRDLATLSGVSAPTLHSWEVGSRTPSPRSLVKVADALDMDIGDLVPVAETRVVLEDMRVQLGLSQRAAAAKAGIAPGAFRDVETGHKRPNEQQVAGFMALLDLDEAAFIQAWTRTRALLIRRLKGV